MSRSQIEAMLAESEVTGDDAHQLHAVLGPLAELAPDAPTPSVELGALFGEDTGIATDGRDGAGADGRRPRGRGTVAGAVVLALAGVGATGLSAAANTLPHAWQHQVSQFSRHYLPFDLPEPAARPQREAEAPDTGPAGQLRRLPDADGGSRDTVDPASTRALDDPRMALETAPPWVGPRSAAHDEPAAASRPGSQPGEGRPGVAQSTDVSATAGRPDRELDDPKAKGREEKRSEEGPQEGRGHDRRDRDPGEGQRASAPAGADRDEQQGSGAARSGSDEAGREDGAGRGDGAGREDAGGRDADSPRTPEGPPAAPPGLGRIGEELGQAVGGSPVQGDAPDA